MRVTVVVGKWIAAVTIGLYGFVFIYSSDVLILDAIVCLLNLCNLIMYM